MYYNGLCGGGPVNIQDSWEKAMKYTEIVRPRVKPLHTFEATRLSYIFLASSLVNPGDTVVRKGEVVVEKPSLVLPYNMPYFEGFNFEEEMNLSQDFLTNFFLVRGISFPSMKYNNKTDSLDIHEGKLESAVSFHGEKLQRSEDVHTGLIKGPEDTWQFSVLIFICSEVFKSADNDFRKLFQDYKKKGGFGFNPFLN